MSWFDPSTVNAVNSIAGIAIGLMISLLTLSTLILNSRTSALKAAVDSLDGLRKGLQERLDRVEKEHAALECEHDKLRKDHARLEQEHAKLKVAYDLLQAAYNKAQDMIRDLQGSVIRLEHENEILRQTRHRRTSRPANPEQP